MSQYRVDKKEEPIAIHFTDQVVREGVVFLSPYASTHPGQETLLDLLRDKDAFLPFRDSTDGFTLVNKSAIAYLSHHKDIGATPLIGDQAAVRITFHGGVSLEGVLTLDMPEGKNRLLDYMNASPGFFALQGTEASYIVNGVQIRDIIPR